MRCQGCGCLALDAQPAPAECATAPDAGARYASLCIAALRHRGFRGGSLLVAAGARVDTGAFLDWARTDGFRVQFLDLSVASVDLAPAAYDAAILLHQMHTHPAPGELLHATRTALRPGAPLLLTLRRRTQWRPEDRWCFNEKPTFPLLMDALLKKEIPGMDREIVVIESNSTDGTRELAKQYQGHPEIKLVLQDRPRGKGHAVREGFRHATGDVVLIQDADLEYDLDDYDALLAPILSHRALFVLGTRHAGDWKIRRFARQKALATGLNLGHAFFTGLINVLFRQNMTDPFTMFKVFRRDCLFGLEFQCNRFDFDHELVIKLVRKGYRPLEIPVNYSSRSFREGKKVRLFRDPFTWLWVDLKLRFARVLPKDLR
jgi:hypothetical protein